MNLLGITALRVIKDCLIIDFKIFLMEGVMGYLSELKKGEEHSTI